MKISIASYSFHGLLREGQIDLFGYLESCRYRYHLDTADIWDGMLVSIGDEHLAKVKDALDERELALVNLCVDETHIWEEAPDARQANHRLALEYLHAAEALGARTLRIDAGGSGESFTEEQFDWVVKQYKGYAQRAYDSGFRVGPENHRGPEVVPENMLRICKAVDHPGYGVLLHFKNGGDRLIAPWAMHTHLSWQVVENRLEECLTMLREVGYSGYWGVEHHSGEHKYARVAVQLARLRELLVRWG